MKLGELSPPALRSRLAGPGLRLRSGPFGFDLHCRIASVADGVALLYAGNELLADDDFADFRIDIAPGRGWRRWLRPQARFLYDGQPVFEPLPRDQAYPLLEWAMNWVIANHAHQFLMLHAAVVERAGRAAILPAPPGSGKSTLCAALVNSGWRLLSDELTLVSMQDGRIWPLCRPVSLKNQSIDVIRRFAPDARFSRVTHDTLKGSVAHMRPHADHVARADLPARAAWVVFPRYLPGSATLTQVHGRADAVVELARNSFNFGVLGRAGFDRLCALIEASTCLDLQYSRLPEAMALFDALAAA